MSDCEDDITTQMHIEKQKNNLHALYKKEYATAVAQIVPSSFPTDAGPLENTGQSPTKFNFTASSRRKISTLMTPFCGGQVAVHNFQIFLVSRVIFFRSLGLLWLLNGFFLGVETQSLCGARASSPRPSGR
ncbi:hypothetical protein BDR04DRAFT_710710 [Suillus decipiens]|nr:hypothetical protein BDR04DRAFT_710710 [Suillus decipiens]